MSINAGSWHVQFIPGTERWVATYMESDDKPQVSASDISRLEMLMDAVDNRLWQISSTEAV